MHPVLHAVADAIAGTPFQNHVYLVGGAVRDELLGLDSPPDFDLVVEGDAPDLARLLHLQQVSSIEPVVFERFGTAMVMIQGERVELVTARSETYDPNSRKPSVTPATIHEDATRRDFTVNALMRRLGTGELVDPLGTGLGDLKAKILRTPLDPADTFSEDPLRMLRAVRFRHKLQFTPAPALYQAITETADRLKIISAERIREELCKMLVLPAANLAVEDLRITNLLHQFWPELEEAVGVDQGDRGDIWQHILGVVHHAPPDLITRLAALLHDVAKPRTRIVESGRIRFPEHDKMGADLATTLMRRLKFSEAEVKAVRTLVRNHMRFGSKGEFSIRAVRRLIRDIGDQTLPLLDLAWADRESYAPGAGQRINTIRQNALEVLQKTPATSLTSPLNGQKIMELTHLSPGPSLAILKQKLEDAVIDGKIPPEDQVAAISLLKSQWRNWLTKPDVTNPIHNHEPED